MFRLRAKYDSFFLNMKHIPVLKEEFLSYLKTLKRFECFLDASFGRGGHTKEVLKHFKKTQITALDWDKEAFLYAQKNFKELFFIQENFSTWENKENKKFEAILVDLGVSSPQLDTEKRGFSFYQNGPLDMRMDQRRELKASHIINQYSEKKLNDLFHEYGEVRSPFKVTRAILALRKKQPILDTKSLSHLIEKTLGWKVKGKHPATPYFLALRIEVNSELENVTKGIPRLIDFLKPQGRLIVISFHSLEDRIVKKSFKKAQIEKKGIILTKKVICPKKEEILMNRRSRSAKMRVFEKGDLT